VVNSSGGGPLVCAINEVGNDGSYTGHSVTASLDLAKWTHVTLTVNAPLEGANGGKGTATIAFNDVDVSSPEHTPIPITVPSQRGEQTLGVGITWASIPSAGWTVLYDNVIFNATAN
jgi:hypothetical protein